MDLGRFKLHSYGFMIFLAFAIGLWISTIRGKKQGFPSAVIMDLTIWIMFGGMLGARLAYVIFHLDEFSGRWLDIISPIQSDGTIGIAGLVVLGGVLTGTLTAWYYLKKRKLSFLKVADVMFPAVALGIALGRIGCFLNGCCFGIPTDLPWGVVFPSECYAGSVNPDIHIHPTQLYSVFYNIGIFLFLTFRTSKKKFDGELFYWFLTFYGVFRFIIEMIRYYREGMIIFIIGNFQFTVSMLTSLLMFIAGLALLIKGFRENGGTSASS